MANCPSIDITVILSVDSGSEGCAAILAEYYLTSPALELVVMLGHGVVH